LRRIKAALDEVHSMTIEEWEDGFRRDRDAEREIASWLYIADIYSQMVAGNKLADRKEKLDILRIHLSCANNPRE
jgi:hypothetical protein